MRDACYATGVRVGTQVAPFHECAQGALDGVFAEGFGNVLGPGVDQKATFALDERAHNPSSSGSLWTRRTAFPGGG